MNYKIFLDDERMPSWIYPNTKDEDWVICRTLTEFKKVITESGIPAFISFDNDLGASMEEGKDAAKWLTYEMGFDISEMDFKVHSANVAGPRKDIESWINNWKKILKNGK